MRRISIASLTVASLLTGSYLNEKVYKKQKGLRKLIQGNDAQVDAKSIISYFKSYYHDPSAVVFPKRLESLQKIIRTANKYGISIMNVDIEETS